LLAGIWTYVRHHHLALLALFIALGGTAYAIEANSVKSKHIADGQVKARDIVPSEVHALGLEVIDTSGGFSCVTDTWFTPLNAQAAYYRDPLGQVQLTGVIKSCGGGLGPPNHLFTLPAGFRPAADDVLLPMADVLVEGERLSVDQDGTVSAHDFNPNGQLALNGLGFRCGPSGENGCP